MDFKVTYTKEEFAKNYSNGYVFATTMGESQKGRPHIAMFKSEEDANAFLEEHPVELMLNADDEDATTEGLLTDAEWKS